MACLTPISHPQSVYKKPHFAQPITLPHPAFLNFTSRKLNFNSSSTVLGQKLQLGVKPSVRMFVTSATAADTALSAEEKKERYPRENKGFVEEMRFVAMKLHTKDQAKEGKKTTKGPEEKSPAMWKPTIEGYLKFPVDNVPWYTSAYPPLPTIFSDEKPLVAVKTLERIVERASVPYYAEFRNTGLERSEKLAKDLEWFKEQGNAIPEPSETESDSPSPSPTLGRTGFEEREKYTFKSKMEIVRSQRRDLAESVGMSSLPLYQSAPALEVRLEDFEPFADCTAFHEFIQKFLSADMTRSRLMDKVRRMKKKYQNLGGSVASRLHDEKQPAVEWTNRYKIAVGVAKGLHYLHKGCQRRIIHRDIKASNILLNDDYEPQISDFGLAKWLPTQLTHHSVVPIEGTVGCLAPEYFSHGIVDEKTDVFAFGVFLLELISGKRPVDAASDGKNKCKAKLPETPIKANTRNRRKKAKSDTEHAEPIAKPEEAAATVVTNL